MSPIINQKFLTEMFYWLQIFFLIKIYKTTNKTQTSYQIFNRLKIQYQNIF
jgi:hypothetical protein